MNSASGKGYYRVTCKLGISFIYFLTAYNQGNASSQDPGRQKRTEQLTTISVLRQSFLPWLFQGPQRQAQFLMSKEVGKTYKLSRMTSRCIYLMGLPRNVPSV